MRKSFNIRILGQNLAVKHDSGDDYVTNVVQYVTGKVQEVQKTAGGVSALTVAILAALNIADDYFKLQETNDAVCNQLEDKSEDLIKLLDEIR
ncbi:MAG: cell division protein ZapA [Smithellaceae bacterium]|nr:cell division protein ZapA [Smithellaceae bacterium]